ncbi:unnamed protein product [Lepeophtheirus salmonis]|uniref:(salmon louse) hypothetical protein n=1 Tax=Lepeophtheirus salmonis TaxID=72036 RepID=A0A7R8CAM1_LEPSM|nr:unnamed protein product [Lepeophtheirus salmonis]CAF2750871.1 unnamed protein product [Lepeophtheirus salmonis]
MDDALETQDIKEYAKSGFLCIESDMEDQPNDEVNLFLVDSGYKMIRRFLLNIIPSLQPQHRRNSSSGKENKSKEIKISDQHLEEQLLIYPSKGCAEAMALLNVVTCSCFEQSLLLILKKDITALTEYHFKNPHNLEPCRRAKGKYGHSEYLNREGSQSNCHVQQILGGTDTTPKNRASTADSSSNFFDLSIILKWNIHNSRILGDDESLILVHFYGFCVFFQMHIRNLIQHEHSIFQI